MILDGVAHPDYRIFYDFRSSVPRALEKLFNRCKGDPDCDKTFPELRDSFFAILERLKSEPVPVRINHPQTGAPLNFDMTYDVFLRSIMPLLYAPETLALLPLTIHAAYEYGDFELLAGQAASIDMGIYPGLMFAVICAEDAPFYPAEKEWQPPGPIDFSSQVRMICDVCSKWNMESKVRIANREVSNVPVLFLSGDADPVTPPESAEKAGQYFPNSLHISLNDMGHGIITRGCIGEIAGEFIRTGSTKNLETSCTDDILPAPFFVNPNGPMP